MRIAGVVGLTLGLCGSARGGDVVYLFQDRVIEAELSTNGATQAIVSPGFGPFVENLSLETEFVTPTGGSATNAARVGIDCQLDPDAIRVVGSLSGAGGLSIVGGNQTLQFGEAECQVETVFLLGAATPFHMTASPRPSTRPGDRFEIKLKNETTGQIIIELNETMPPQAVNLQGVLPAAEYELEFQAELTVDGPEVLREFFFNLRLGACYPNCDESTAPPELSPNDFVCFLNRYTSGDTRANCDGSSAAPVLTANDFACFLQAYAVGCD